jgi:hypothetical protein
MGFQGMRKSTVLPNAQSRPPRAPPASTARRRRPQHREFPTGYSLAGCSPAEPASASPAAPVYVHRPVRHNQLRCPHFLSPSASISRLRNQHTACHSRALSRQSSETEHESRGLSFRGTSRPRWQAIAIASAVPSGGGIGPGLRRESAISSRVREFSQCHEELPHPEERPGAAGARLETRMAPNAAHSDYPPVPAYALGGYLSSQMSSRRLPLKMLLTMIVRPLTQGCQQVPPRE